MVTSAAMGRSNTKITYRILFHFLSMTTESGAKNANKGVRESKIAKARRSAYFIDLLYPSPFVIPLPLGG